MGWTERRERRKDDSKMAGGDGWREAEIGLSSSNNNRVSCPATAPWPRSVNCKEADRRTMEETRGGEVEERTTDGQGDGWGKQLSALSRRGMDRSLDE